MKAQHSPTVPLTTGLLALISVWQLAGPLVPGRDQIPPAVEIGAVVLGIAGLIAVAGLWTGKQWGRPLALIVAAVSGLGSLSGIVFAPTVLLHVSATLTVAAAIAIIVLGLSPSMRRAFGTVSSTSA
jgi:hypothetical protein